MTARLWVAGGDVKNAVGGPERGDGLRGPTLDCGGKRRATPPWHAASTGIRPSTRPSSSALDVHGICAIETISKVPGVRKSDSHSKAAWRFASRRTPKGRGQQASAPRMIRFQRWKTPRHKADILAACLRTHQAVRLTINPMRLYQKASSFAAAGLALSLCVVAWPKLAAVLTDESSTGSASSLSNRNRAFKSQRIPTKAGRDRIRTDEAAIGKGIPMQEAKRLLAEAGATDISTRIQTTPLTRLVVSEDNAYEIADEYQIPRTKTRKEMSDYINTIIDQRLPRYAELSYWILPDGAAAELYASGEDKHAISLTSIAVFPNGYPLDKLRTDSERVVISKLRVRGNEIYWRSDATSKARMTTSPEPHSYDSVAPP